tara:strand:+ start:4349 stop:5512 length:1164 start_codon:yes stop_codon:yes gene_type:complete
MKKKIIIYSSSRADIDRYIPIIKKITEEGIFKPILFLSSFHKVEKFGDYKYEIKKLKIELIDNNFNKKLNDNYSSIIEHYCSDIKKFNKILIKLKPSMIIILGDRFEITSAVMPSILQNIVIVHLYGGAVTEGAIDDKIRHAVTKLSNVHLVLHKKYFKRVIQLGEEPWRTKLIGLDFLNELKKQKTMSKKDLFKKLKLEKSKKTFFATYHPVTLEKKDHKYQIKNFLDAIKKSDYQCIFTYPNSDSGNNLIVNEIKKFINKNNDKYIFLKKLNLAEYTSVLKHCDAIIGNSSMGIVDSASFKKPVINIGNRQTGKIFPKNIIQTRNNLGDIMKSINLSQSFQFKKNLKNLKNPYAPKKYNLSKFLKNLLRLKKNKINKKKFIDKII